MNGKMQYIIPYVNPSFFEKLSDGALLEEEKWFYALYKLQNPDSTESKKDVLEKYKNWQDILKNYLKYGEMELGQDIGEQLALIEKIEGTVENFVNEKGTELLMDHIWEEIAANMDIQGRSTKKVNPFLKGLENEYLLAGRRYAWAKGLDSDITYKESEGDKWVAQMKADFTLGIPNKHFNSKVFIPFEAKTSLEHFHVSEFNMTVGDIMSTAISNASVKNSPDTGKLTLQLKKSDMEDVALMIAKRKFEGRVSAHPVYEDKNSFVLPSDMFNRFAKKGLDLWYHYGEKESSLHQIISEGTDVEDVNDIEAIKEAITKRICKKANSMNLWYGKSS